MKCKKHVWNVEPPTPYEAFCKECGTLYSGKGRPRKAAAPSGQSLLSEVASEMTGLGIGETETSSDETSDGSANDVPRNAIDVAAKPPSWCKGVGKNIAEAYVLIIEGSLKRFAGRQTRDPNEDTVDELGAAMGEQLALWFPDSDMTPAIKIGIAAAGVAATMIVGSTVIKPQQRVQSASMQNGTRVVAGSAETPKANESQQSTDVALPVGLL